MADVFLSYALQDRPVADRLAAALKENNLTVWLDKSELRPGENWVSAISEAVQNSKSFVVIISKASVQSNYLTSEIAAAIAARSVNPEKRIFPVITERGAAIPSFIDQFQYIDLSESQNFNIGVDRLVQAIKSGETDNAEKHALSLEKVRMGSDKIIEQIDFQKGILVKIENERNQSIRLSFFSSALTTIIGFISAAFILYYPEKLSDFRSIFYVALPAVTALMGSIAGFYFGTHSKEKNQDIEGEVRK